MKIDFNECFSLTEVVSIETRVQDTYTWGFGSFDEGRDHVREIMRETVNNCMVELSDDEVDIDAILDEILENGEENEDYGRWTWDCAETEIVWELQKFCKIPESK